MAQLRKIRLLHITQASKKSITGMMFACLGTVPIVLFFMYPLIWTFRLSLYSGRIGRVEKFVGFANYFSLLQDPSFWHSFRITMQYAVIMISLELIFGLIIALSLNVRTKKGARSKRAIRAVLLIPLVIPAPAIAAIWYYMFEGSHGIINTVLTGLGIMEKKISLLFTPSTVLYAIVAASLSITVFLTMLLLDAGLKAIPEETYEAAEIDGASSWQRFFRITLPLLKPTISFVVVFRCFDLIQVFSLIYILTEGGPARATDVLAINLYRQAFHAYKMGYASAMSFAILGIIILFSLSYLKLSKGYEK